MVYIDEKKIGDIIRINDTKFNGKADSEYIIIQKGRPSTAYDQSCDGVWLMRKNSFPIEYYHSVSNSYADSMLRPKLADDYEKYTDSLEKIIRVKVPYYKGRGNDSTSSIQTGSNGIEGYGILLSATEMGLTACGDTTVMTIGTTLEYFKSSYGNSKTCTLDSGAAIACWTRTPVQNTQYDVYCVSESGVLIERACHNPQKAGYRPVIVVPKNLRVDENNFLLPPNAPPEITSDLAAQLGELSDGFSCNYSVDDENETDPLTVTLKLDNSVIQTFPGVRDQQESYTLGGHEWLKVPNGDHTFKICVNDGRETIEKVSKFTRNCTSMSFILSEPLQTDELACAINLKFIGDIPHDAAIKFEACNNANDTEPAWEDITQRVTSGLSHVFKNKTPENGFAINFRITASRGASNSGGYIEKIICEYE